MVVMRYLTWGERRGVGGGDECEITVPSDGCSIKLDGGFCFASFCNRGGTTLGLACGRSRLPHFAEIVPLLAPNCRNPQPYIYFAEFKEM